MGSEPDMTNSKGRILLAEDDVAILKVTQLRLTHAGFEVVTASDGEEALHLLLQNGGIELVLLDLKMPKLDGFEVCQRLKADPRTAKIPIIIFTASSIHWNAITDKCIELGVTDWLKKPFQSKELIDKIRKALGQPGAAHA